MNKKHAFSAADIKAAAQISQDMQVEIELRSDGTVLIKPISKIKVQDIDGSAMSLEDWLSEN